MFDLNQLSATEVAVGFRYPAALWSVACELASLFTAASLGGRTATPDDVAEAWELGLASSLVPFACVPQQEHTDYYCCEMLGGPAVTVFADHAVVAEWLSFADFLAWSRSAAADQRHAES